MNDDPAEHVFQFVVVNQKATPMTKALLGTIVSTSLASEELHPIAQRLHDAGIELEDSRAVAYLTRASESPFKDLVATGVRGDRPGALQWNVLKKLVEIFRELEGGRLYNLPNIDQARDWKERYLAETGLIPDVVASEDRKDCWSRLDGPWRDLFIRFFTFIRDVFGDPDDMRAHNAWGNTQSNLFNMIHLTILSADFFAYLNQKENALRSWDAVDEALSNWITGVNSAYFNREWGLTVKKDLPAVRKAWAQTWYQYRLSPGRLPRAENFRP